MHSTVLDVHDKQIQLCLLCPLGRLADPSEMIGNGTEPEESLYISVNSWWAGRYSSIAKFYLLFKECI